MDSIEERVRAESERFHAALPTLTQRYAGRWVIYMDGEVQGDYPTLEAAYRAAIEKYGPDGGFVVGQVVERPATPIHAGAIFGEALL